MRAARLALPAVLILPVALGAQTQRPPFVALPADMPTDVQARERMREGQRLLKEDEFAAAAKVFEEAIALDPLLMMAHHGLGTARMAQKEYPAAVAAFEAARDAFQKNMSESAEIRARVATARAERIRRLEDQIRNAPEPTRGRTGREGGQRQALQEEVQDLQRLQEEAKRPPQLPAGFSLALGSAYFRTGRLADAEREYRAAIEAGPRLGEPRVNLAVVLLMTGHAPEAKEQLAMAEKNGFKPPAGLKADVDASIAKARTP